KAANDWFVTGATSSLNGLTHTLGASCAAISGRYCPPGRRTMSAAVTGAPYAVIVASNEHWVARRTAGQDRLMRSICGLERLALALRGDLLGTDCAALIAPVVQD